MKKKGDEKERRNYARKTKTRGRLRGKRKRCVLSWPPGIKEEREKGKRKGEGIGEESLA